jgi:hypothetical protein
MRLKIKDALKEVKKELEKKPEPKVEQIPVGLCAKVINKITGK